MNVDMQMKHFEIIAKWRRRRRRFKRRGKSFVFVYAKTKKQPQE